MRILALQPYNAMSHRAFLEGWQRNSRHTIDVMALPGRHFKWRMRQAPVGFANLLAGRSEQPPFYDALWCTSMLDLATLRGISREVQRLPAAVYFHENQLTYPTRYEGQRDLHFGLTNMTTALAAIESCQSVGDPCVWWNSAYNRDSFLDALNELIKTMPDEQPAFVVERIRRHSAVHYPGIDPVEKVPARYERAAATALGGTLGIRQGARAILRGAGTARPAWHRIPAQRHRRALRRGPHVFQTRARTLR